MLVGGWLVAAGGCWRALTGAGGCAAAPPLLSCCIPGGCRTLLHSAGRQGQQCCFPGTLCSLAFPLPDTTGACPAFLLSGLTDCSTCPICMPTCPPSPAQVEPRTRADREGRGRRAALQRTAESDAFMGQGGGWVGGRAWCLCCKGQSTPQGVSFLSFFLLQGAQRRSLGRVPAAGASFRR